MDLSVVATTRCNGTHSLLTSAKLTEGYRVVRIIRELDKEPSLHCSFIYINYMWSILQQYLPALISLKVDLIFISLFHFIFIFIFIFNLFSIFRTRIRVKWWRSHCHMTGHIRWHSNKSHDARKNIESSGRMMLYNVLNTCWP